MEKYNHHNSYNNKSRKEYVSSLPAWNEDVFKFVGDMATHAPFIVTRSQGRSDLGDCVISLEAPHIVCKIHAFKTHPVKAFTPGQMKPKQKKYGENEERRFNWLQQRREAFRNGQEARKRGITVRQYVTGLGMVYDEEIDEPRIIIKVPGLNVYLELLGCLDNVDEAHTDFAAILAELEKMGRWSLNIYTMQDRRAYASDAHDYQPLPEWHDNYNCHLRPWMPYRRGLGFTFIDPSRREDDYLHLHSSDIDKEDYERIKAKRQAQIIMARRGIAPGNYGGDDRKKE